MIRYIAIGLFVMLTAGSRPGFASNALTNFKSGISIGFNGEDGADYVFERWYHDPGIDDHGTVYIKSTTPITLQHNERNVDAGGNPVGGDSAGVIRFRMDRDLQWKHTWADVDDNDPFPAYTGPFSFSQLEYESGVPVVGTTGPVPGIDQTDKVEYYYRGMSDSSGDEWHVMMVGDDDGDWAMHTNFDMGQNASDGKIHYFIVNPLYPAIYFTAADSAAQYYTTPPKAYFVPKIHDQTSYVSGNVTVSLVNIMSAAPVQYRFDDDAFTAYTGPISMDVLSDGEHVLEYYYDAGHVKVRKIIKNPGFPSDNDTFTGDSRGHGYLLWANDAEFDAIKARLNSTDSTRMADYGEYRKYRDWTSKNGNGQDFLATDYGKGLRAVRNYMLRNALVARVEGLPGAERYAAAAKRMMLESERNVDPVGFEKDHQTDALPSKELMSAGYYSVNAVYNIAFTYDLLINEYRYPEYAGGITPIEDYKIRDIMAAFCVESLLMRGHYMTLYSIIGMWGHARNAGSLVAAMAMPGYDTPYFGTAGFDGTPATATHVPFPEYAVTWKDAFFENDCTLNGYPNMTLEFGLLQYTNILGKADGHVAPDGMTDLGAYNSYAQQGHVLIITGNVCKIRMNRTFPALDLSFKRSAEGTQSVSHGGTVGYYPQLPVVNERFSAAADTAQRKIKEGDGVSYWMYRTGVTGLCWYHDDWKDHVAGIREGLNAAVTSPVVPDGLYDIGGQPVRGRAMPGVYVRVRNGTAAGTVICD